MMQPQGLASLTPQGPQAPQMDNPRLAAAMDVVTSDAEKNILDPRTLALIKYKDAVQAMQAADQMMAAARPQPMPPTVAERTKLAAEQGLVGLASRLAPGVQQRGAQMAAQQGAGGLPQLAAPNMARMAGGGIVAFNRGGGPVGVGSAYVDPVTGEPLSVAERAALLRDKLVESLFGKPREGFTGPLTKEQFEERNLRNAPGAPLPEDLPVPFATSGASEEPTLPRGLGVASIMPGGVARSVETPQTAAAPIQPSGIETVLAEALAPETQAVARPSVDESGLAGLLKSRLEEQLQPGFADERGRDIEDRARAAYAIPQEMRDLIQARIDQMNTPEFTPEELRKRRVQAWLQGLASSPYIAESGVAAAQGREAVMERSRQDAKERADKQFALSYELMGKDREASINAFKDGLAASDRAMAQVTGAVQSAAGMVSSELNREQSALIQESQNRMTGLQLEAEKLQAELDRGDKNIDRLTGFYGDLVKESDDLARAIASVTADSMLASSEGGLALIQTLTEQKALVDEMKNAARLHSAGGVGLELPTPELEQLLELYGTPQ